MFVAATGWPRPHGQGGLAARGMRPRTVRRGEVEVFVSILPSGDLMVFDSDFMGFYSDFMGFYSDLMGFYSDLMGFYSDLMGF